MLPGSFNPPHEDHTKCLEAAAAAAEAAGYAVVGALLQPSSESYLKNKCGAASCMSLANRVRVCDVACSAAEKRRQAASLRQAVTSGSSSSGSSSGGGGSGGGGSGGGGGGSSKYYYNYNHYNHYNTTQ